MHTRVTHASHTRQLTSCMDCSCAVNSVTWSVVDGRREPASLPALSHAPAAGARADGNGGNDAVNGAVTAELPLGPGYAVVASSGGAAWASVPSP